MTNTKKAVFFGFLTWLIPFLFAFLFVDSSGSYRIEETFFKTIMIVVGAAVGTKLAVKYFQEVERNYVQEGLTLGVLWLAINWSLDLILVYAGMFDMSYYAYFTDIGLRYLSAPIYTVGIGKILQLKLNGKTKK